MCLAKTKLKYVASLMLIDLNSISVGEVHFNLYLLKDIK